ncbi:DUF4998 domain-containing protein [Sphingobacterium bovistauri]|uniref:DUF4998 domain-containing protein n=1 Tax=Sphingobacterium bovistauri TaxID=2781959 RepID=A0ABS7Z5L1_9SPHI|nr:DUF4998 domain-containing protein [Sphingobacterium bovistauri]MCA5005458.1 hypothetical protein [Sphingobacterium bovistauri]
MKKILNYSCLSIILLFVSCVKSDDYKKHLASGEIRYAAKPEDLKAFPGRERIKLQWRILSDQNIVKAKIYWRNKSDSTEVVINRTAGIDTINTIIPLREGSYSFDVVHYHTDGSRSLAANVSSNSYGASYESTLINRRVQSVTFTPSNQGVKISWGVRDATTIGMQVFYVTTAATGSLPRLPIRPATEAESSFTRVENNINMEYKTLFKPDTAAIDTFYAPLAIIPVKY